MLLFCVHTCEKVLLLLAACLYTHCTSLNIVAVLVTRVLPCRKITNFLNTYLHKTHFSCIADSCWMLGKVLPCTIKQCAGAWATCAVPVRKSSTVATCKRSRVLLRDFIQDCLYNKSYGYFAAKVTQHKYFSQGINTVTGNNQPQ